MNHPITLTLWLMISPGTWEVTPLVFDTQDECNHALNVFKKLSIPAKPWKRWHEYLIEDYNGSGIMWVSNCDAQQPKNHAAE